MRTVIDTNSLTGKASSFARSANIAASLPACTAGKWVATQAANRSRTRSATSGAAATSARSGRARPSRHSCRATSSLGGDGDRVRRLPGQGDERETHPAAGRVADSPAFMPVEVGRRARVLGCRHLRCVRSQPPRRPDPGATQQGGRACSRCDSCQRAARRCARARPVASVADAASFRRTDRAHSSDASSVRADQGSEQVTHPSAGCAPSAIALRAR